MGRRRHGCRRRSAARSRAGPRRQPEGRRPPSRTQGQGPLLGRGGWRGRPDDAGGHHALPAPAPPHRGRRGRPPDPPGARTPGTSAAGHAPPEHLAGGLGRGLRPVPPLAPRLLAGRDRRGVRSRHHPRRHGLPALRGHRRRRRGGPADDPRAQEPPHRDPPRHLRALLPARLGSDGRGLRPRRRQAPHRHRLPRGQRHPNQGGRARRGGVRGLEHRRLREPRGGGPPARLRHLVRAHVAGLRHAPGRR